MCPKIDLPPVLIWLASEGKGQSINPGFAQLFQSGRAERVQLVEDLWDSIVQEDEKLPVSTENCGTIYSVFHCSQNPEKWQKRLGHSGTTSKTGSVPT